MLDDVERRGEELRLLAARTDGEREQQLDRAARLDEVARAVAELSHFLGVDVPAPLSTPTERLEGRRLPADFLAAVGSVPEGARTSLDTSLQKVRAVPPLDTLDRFVIVSVGCLAALADLFLVGSPHATHFTPSAKRGVVGEGLLERAIKSQALTADNNNLLARLCKVPFDRSSVPGPTIGMAPPNHRIFSLAHDPSPAGFVFALIDIAAGRTTGIGYKGVPFSVPGGIPASWVNTMLAPVLWVGHLLSDAATPMGLPVPGMGLLRLLPFTVPGADGATVRDVLNTLYLRGYDLRHYLVGAVVPGLVEGLIRLYYLLRYADEKEVAGTQLLNLAEREVARMRTDARLHALLFWAHAIAAGANAGRVAIQGAVPSGGFFAAASAINVAEWQLFAVRSIQYARARLRDTSLDQVLENRRRIDDGWEDLLADYGTGSLFYMPPAPGGPQPGEVVLGG